jgi:solute carrier family 13 (sodium-dependent dicarboxylate transporter), member 2/3/5
VLTGRPGVPLGLGGAVSEPKAPKIDPTQVDKEHGHTSKAKTRSLPLNFLLVGFAAVAGFITYLVLPDSLDEPQRRMATIFVIALVLWVTEGIPLFATSLFIIVCEVWWLAVPSDLGIDIDYQEIFSALSHPIIFLFLGGFILAKGVQREGIDEQMASFLMRPFGSRPAYVLLGIMVITAVFSMWMSNTATTAMMIVLIQPIAAKVPPGDPFRKGLILAVPFAANVGGVGTPIGTPPNAIALALLDKAGYQVNFFQWMALGVPLLAISIIILWTFLRTAYRTHDKSLRIKVEGEFQLTFNAASVYLCFFLTVALWLTSPLHGIPTAVVAMVPAAWLTATGIIGRKDFNSLDWDVLMLIAGGIALGHGLTLTGLDDRVVALLPVESLSFTTLAAICCLAVVVLSTVMSNTVATNIILPVALALAAALADGGDIRVLAVLVAIAASFAVGLPISTPPNVIAYGSGLVSTRDIMFVGGVTSCAATIVLILTGPHIVGFVLSILG